MTRQTLPLVTLIAGFVAVSAVRAPAVILWSDLGETTVRETGPGIDILGGVVKRDSSSNDTLYFKFHVNPHSDVSTEEYFAGFQLFEGDTDRLGVGNSLKAWAYSAFNASETGESNSIAGDFDLQSSRPDPRGLESGLQSFFRYELPRRGIESTILFKVQYRPGTNALVTVWLNPDLSPGTTEADQSERLTTRFTANADFNQIHLRHGGGGEGWTFSDMAIASSFDDFVAPGGATGFTFKSWQTEQGLPQNSVRALAQTRDGYLWVGTDEGLARFDGVRFVPFDKRRGLRSAPVRVLFEDSRGTLWIGTSAGGLTRFQSGQFTTFTIRDGLPADTVTALAEDREGRLWVGTEGGLAVWENEQLTPSTAPEIKGKSIAALFKDRTGTMWVGATGAGVFRFSNGGFTALPDASPEHLLQDPHCLLVDRAGRIWIGAGDGTVLCRDGDRWDRHSIRRRLARPYVSTLAETPDGAIWAGTMSEGLIQFKDGRLTTIDVQSGLLDNLVESLLADREGNLWVGTGAGLDRLRRSNLSVMEANKGLGYGAVQGLAEIEPGVIWAGKPSDGLYGQQGDKFSRLTGERLPGRYLQICSLLAARDGSCWVGGAHGVVRIKDPGSSLSESELALAGLNVISLCQSLDGEIWAGTREGELWSWLDGKWTMQTNFSQAHAITALAPDPRGALWIGTEGGGVYWFKEKVLAHLDTENGLLSDLVRTLYLDPQGTLWIGTAGGGLSSWRSGHMTNYTTSEGLPDDTISQILEDGEGRLWLGSNRGIACVSKRELDGLTPGKILHPLIYGRTEGMLSEECTGGFYPAGLKTKSGLLWFSTLKGIVVVDPRSQMVKTSPPTVRLEEVLVDGAPVPEFPLADAGGGTNRHTAPEESNLVRIPPGKHRVEFRYTGFEYAAPDQIRFRYRLDKLDPDWIEAEDQGKRRNAVYYPPAGDYRFRVMAGSSDGVWNEGAEVKLPLKVSQFIWQTWWFITLAGVGLLAAVGGTGRLIEIRRFRRQLRRLEQERALERERARISQDLHDDLGSSLARISLLSGLVRSDKENPAQVEAHAAKISQSANQTVRALEEIVWAVRPGSDSLQSLIDYIAHFASELFEGDGTRCRLDLPHDLPPWPLPPDVRHNIFLVVKEALTNALKHAGAKEVSVQAKVSGRSLEILVHDDGAGFDTGQSPAEGKRHGLGNMRERATAMDSKLTVRTERGRGTTVSLVVDFAKISNGR
jgi:ligand-binding sensor domain-containing protein/signal transduction histidine kinase